MHNYLGDLNITYVDQIYEGVDFPGEYSPPVPPRESKPGRNKQVDNDGYLKIIPNHTRSNTTGVDAHETVQLRQKSV